MIFTTRDLDILRFLRWCRFVLAKDLTGVFSKGEVQNLEILRLIKLYQPAQAYTLTAAGNRLLDAAFPKLPAAVAPAYKAADTIRRIRQAKLMTTAYQAGVSVFTSDVSALCEQAMFLPMIARNRGSNPWGSTRVAALLHTGDLMCAIHWVSPGIGCVALTDELTAFQNHTVAIPAKQRVIIFAASSYEEILSELDTVQEKQNTRLQSYREVYDCLKLPLFLLPCNGTGCLQLRILSVPNYRELLARIILKSHYVLPPANVSACVQFLGIEPQHFFFQRVADGVRLCLGFAGEFVIVVHGFNHAHDFILAHCLVLLLDGDLFGGYLYQLSIL